MRGIRSFAKHETEEVLAIRRGDKQRKGNVTMRRKLIACGLMAVLMLSGCAAQSGTETNSPATAPASGSHTHTAAEAYSWNGTEHWFACECGEKIDAAAHHVGDDLRCDACGLEILELDDGYVDVTGYDEYDNVCVMISYDPEGNVLSSVEFRYTYDERGNTMGCEYFSDGVLQGRDEYLPDGNGGTVIFSSSSFFEGETNYNEYDEYGNMVYYAHYNADNVITHESRSEYAPDSNGDYYECREISTYEDGSCSETEYNQYGEATLRRFCDADGNPLSEDVWEYGYSEEGKMEWMKEYRDGVLIREILNFAVFTDEWDVTSGYPENVIEYYEDGSRLVIFNGTNSEPETETLYNADGSVAWVRSYKYEYFEDGNWKRILVYQDDVLIRDTQYAMGEEWSRKASVTEYHEDGTRTVWEYDENEEIVSEKNYDADGNEI